MKSGPSSNDKNRDDKSDSRSSIRNCGHVRYWAESVSVPIGWGIDGNSCESLGRGGDEAVRGVSVHEQVSNHSDLGNRVTNSHASDPLLV